jgi:LPXTG-motif cell wall-anchored protein
MPTTGTVDHAAALPKTGAPVGSIAALGAGLLAVGAMTLMAGRRRPVVDGVSDDSEI